MILRLLVVPTAMRVDCDTRNRTWTTSLERRVMMLWHEALLLLLVLAILRIHPVIALVENEIVVTLVTNWIVLVPFQSLAPQSRQ